MLSFMHCAAFTVIALQDFNRGAFKQALQIKFEWSLGSVMRIKQSNPAFYMKSETKVQIVSLEGL